MRSRGCIYMLYTVWRGARARWRGRRRGPVHGRGALQARDELRASTQRNCMQARSARERRGGGMPSAREGKHGPQHESRDGNHPLGKPDAGGSTRAATATRARSTAAATACSFASCAALIMRAARHRPAAQEKGSTKARERGETSAASTRRTACKHAAREQAASETLHFCDVSFGDKFFACSSFPV